jgi:membrane associated rhomboid family serine protease
MGLYDREYTQPEYRQQRFGLPDVRFSLPRMTPVVKWLLILNFALFILVLIPPLGSFLAHWCALDTRSWLTIVQPWRIITYQFLHSRTDAAHIFLNMLALFMLAPPLERFWGSRRFLFFYLGCGVAGGLAYVLLATTGVLGTGIMVGASGAILGVLAACAILFPHFNLIIFVFPVPIRIAAIGLLLIGLVNILTGGANLGGDVAHLGGAAAGATYVLLQPAWGHLTRKRRSGSWEKRLEQSRRLQVEVDRILAKVHRSGLHSLSSREKKALKQATREEIRRQQL